MTSVKWIQPSCSNTEPIPWPNTVFNAFMVGLTQMKQGKIRGAIFFCLCKSETINKSKKLTFVNSQELHQKRRFVSAWCPPETVKHACIHATFNKNNPLLQTAAKYQMIGKLSVHARNKAYKEARINIKWIILKETILILWNKSHKPQYNSWLARLMRSP